MSQADLEHAKLWLQGYHRTVNPRLTPGNLSALAVAAAVNADKPVAAVPSAAAIGGADGRATALKADKALKDAGNRMDDLVDVLKANPIVGATSVMDISMKRSNYNPLEPAKPNNFDSYQAYVKDIVHAPFFHLNYADQKALHQSSSDWDTLIGDIVSLFEGIVSEDHTRIVKGLKQLAHSATATKDTTETMNVFSQQAIAVNSSAITVGIYHSSVSMIEHQGKHTTRQADFTVHRAFLTFYTEMWPFFAPAVAAAKISSTTDWLKGASSI